MSLRLMVVEDHEIVSQALRDMLDMESSFEVVTLTTSGEKALEQMRSDPVDVVLMDVKLEGSMTGIEATREIKQRWPETKVVVLTMFTDPATVADAIRAGADAYISKGSSKELLVRTIEDVTEGRSVLDPNVTEGMFEQFSGRDPKSLTDRETAVLQQLSNGSSTREVAQNMFVSEETIKTYLKQVFKKLDVKDRTEAVAEAFRRGLIH